MAKSRAEMMKLLTETAFQEEREAAGKWRRAQLSVTQLSTYFVGFSEHMETREAAKKRDGDKFNLKKYHDGILAFGSPPGRYARALDHLDGRGPAGPGTAAARHARLAVVAGPAPVLPARRAQPGVHDDQPDLPLPGLGPRRRRDRRRRSRRLPPLYDKP